MKLDLCRSEHPDGSGQLTQPIWFEDEIYPFFPRKWVNCPYFSMKRFVIDFNCITNNYKQLHFHLIVGILIVDCRLGL